MTESEWLQCADPLTLWGLLTTTADERKLRLLGCAWVRALPVWREDAACRQAVEAMEHFADGLATPAGLDLAVVRAWKKGWEPVRAAAAALATGPAAGLEDRLFRLGQAAAERAVRNGYAADKAAGVLGLPWGQRWVAARRAQTGLLREVLGNPFRPAALDPEWLAWHDGCVRRLARGLYDERRFGDLPFLADALEEAGCEEPGILAHLRSPGLHVPGCWAVDLVLGRTRRGPRRPGPSSGENRSGSGVKVEKGQAGRGTMGRRPAPAAARLAPLPPAP
jgi:hypothetical protein